MQFIRNDIDQPVKNYFKRSNFIGSQTHSLHFCLFNPK